jgi:hypothetical protein
VAPPPACSNASSIDSKSHQRTEIKADEENGSFSSLGLFLIYINFSANLFFIVRTQNVWGHLMMSFISYPSNRKPKISYSYVNKVNNYI